MQVQRVLDRKLDGIVRSQRRARSDLGAGHHVLLPVLIAQEILSCKLALSEGGRTLEERDIDEHDALGAGALGDLLRHHLTDERNRYATEAM
jgi:hypothetical protein